MYNNIRYTKQIIDNPLIRLSQSPSKKMKLLRYTSIKLQLIIVATRRKHKSLLDLGYLQT